jgi:hypothetical protein
MAKVELRLAEREASGPERERDRGQPRDPDRPPAGELDRHGGVGDEGSEPFGGYGVDTMSGAGEDIFDVNSGDSGVGPGGRDIITDFLPSADRIDVNSIDARVGVTGDQAFRFLGTDPFTATGQLRFAHAGGNTIVQVSVDGDRQPEGELQLTGVLDLAGRDFLV